MVVAVTKEYLKKAFLLQYMEEIAPGFGGDFSDALWSWQRCRSEIETLDDVDSIIGELKNE